MPLTILSDSDVSKILENLTLQDVEMLQGSLRKALHEYSTGNQDQGCCSMNQPDRTSLVSEGRTTLFMPSVSSQGLGMKVVTLVAPGHEASTNITAAHADTTPHGALTIMASNGEPTGFVNAEEITAFRTALASSLLLTRRTTLKNLSVFGAGKQAFWHIRLALLLRGNTIKHVNIVNRVFSERARDMMKHFLHIDHETKKREGWANTKFGMLSPAYGEYNRMIKDQLRLADAIICTVPSTTPLFDHTILTNTEGRKKGRLVIAIGSYKPHMIEVPTELLHQATKPSHDHRHFHKHATEGGVVVVDTLTGCMKEAGEIVQSGLSPQQLVEIGELVMLDGQYAAIADDDASSRKSSDVDISKLSMDSSSTLNSLGSVFSEESSAGSTSSRTNSFSLKSSRRSSKSSSAPTTSSDVDSKKSSKQEDHMCKWLREGNVIYKSVGMGLMDLVVGGDLVTLARQKGVGVTLKHF